MTQPYTEFAAILRAAGHGKGSSPRDVLIDGLVKGLGFSRGAATVYVDRFSAEIALVMSASAEETGE